MSERVQEQIQPPKANQVPRITCILDELRKDLSRLRNLIQKDDVIRKQNQKEKPGVTEACKEVEKSVSQSEQTKRIFLPPN